MRCFGPNFSCECRIELKFYQDVRRVISSNFHLWQNRLKTTFDGYTGALWVFVLGNSENSPGMDTWQLLGACGQVVVGGGCAGSMGGCAWEGWSVGIWVFKPTHPNWLLSLPLS